VLVTGASGYIGRTVVHQLLAEGLDVTVLEHRTRRRWSPSVRVRRGDVLQPAALSRAVEGMDAVCHLAADGTVRHRTAEDADRQWRIITEGTRNLLVAMERSSGFAQVRGEPLRLVNLSSAAAYGGDPGRPLRPGGTGAPGTSYGAAKLAAETAIADAARAGRVAALSLRVFTVAGRGPDTALPSPVTLIPQAVAAATGRTTGLTVHGDGSAVRDFVHVRDVASAVAAALRHAEAGEHRVFDVGASPARVMDVVRLVERVCGRTIPLTHRSSPGGGRPALLVADTAGTHAALGWAPAFSALSRLVVEQMRDCR
jgi:UDP-glucose 4-epimerase